VFPYRPLNSNFWKQKSAPSPLPTAFSHNASLPGSQANVFGFVVLIGAPKGFPPLGLKYRRVESLVFCLFVFCCVVFWYWFELRASSHLLDRHSSTGTTLSALFCFSYFSGRISYFCLGPTSDCYPSYLCILVAGSQIQAIMPSLLVEIQSQQLFARAGIKMQFSQSLPPE
jgi:hypothetical protein